MGDGGDAVDYSAADLAVAFGTEAVEAAAAAPEDDFGDVLVSPGGGGDAGRLRAEEPDLIELTWVEPDTRSGP
ncbi:hypothetical protein [Glycomyces sp. YM15]|uniref:hypothetical protein n=1 Tax=Glycomyces sp. YM15 TaxID=2800446 RepID=UPI0019669316|nr:hypothetical protein [Glycomyces sp. YM15]